MPENNRKSEDGRCNGDVTMEGLPAKKRSWLLGVRRIKGIVFQICQECSHAHHRTMVGCVIDLFYSLTLLRFVIGSRRPRYM